MRSADLLRGSTIEAISASWRAAEPFPHLVFDDLVTPEALAAIPEPARGNYVLQERVSFTPMIETPHGPTQIELRIMFVRDGSRYRAVMPLGRMGRGLMMGVDHNKGLSWVGAAAVVVGE